MFDSYAEIFLQRAGEYHGAIARWPDARDAEFRAVLDPFENAPDGLICDMPSGGGYLAHHLRAGLDYVGVEPADGFFDADNRGLRRVKSDLGNVTLADGSVDHLVSLAGLHHESDLGRVFREMRRLVRTGGLVVIADAAAGTPPAHFLNGFVDRHNPQGHEGRFFDDKTAALVEAAGLRIVEDELTPVPWAFDSEAEAGAFCKKLFWLPELASEAVAEALAGEIGFIHRDGRVLLDWTLRRFICVSK